VRESERDDESGRDRSRAALPELQQQLASRGYRLTEVRILDMLIWSVSAAT
jgi:hypothetical protein